MTAPHSDIAKYVTPLICEPGVPSIVTYRQKPKNAQMLGRMLMCTLGAELFSENLAKRAANQKLRSTMRITTSPLKLYGYVANVI